MSGVDLDYPLRPSTNTQHARRIIPRGYNPGKRRKKRIGEVRKGRPERNEFDGKSVITGLDVRYEYIKGPFWYQFRKKGWRSRVCLCNNQPECDWLAEQVNSGARIVTRHVAGS